ncbi:MAG: ISKra4 family transposase [Planctomycetota bacterium]|jgi:hypothetical protein
MKLKIQVIIESESNETPVTEEIASLTREDLTPETLGLTLAEAKDLLASTQETIVKHQVTEYLEQQRSCPHCGKTRAQKGKHEIVFRSLFGKLKMQSPRFYTCSCQSQSQRSFSPLAEHLPQRTTPELLYLQTKWASLMSYGLTVELLEEVLPLDASVATVFRNLHTVAERSERELGNERYAFIDGCQRDWDNLPRPGRPITVGIDGGYVQAREGENRKAGFLEAIVGKIITAEGGKKSFGFVNGYDQKPKRRLFEMLKAQGLQMNQTIIFLSDGGDTVRDLQFYHSPCSEHLLDWFHITMRITVMKQICAGLPQDELLQDIEKNIDRIKWYLWHGNVFMALQILDDVIFDLEAFDEESSAVSNLFKHLSEFQTYIAQNRSFIPNYGERYHYGDKISTGFAESTVNQVVSKRMVKKQQMRWTKKGAHLLLQVRTQVLNDDWRKTFCRWYPAMKTTEEEIQIAA